MHLLSRSNPEACFWNEKTAFGITLSRKSSFSNRELPICVGCWRCCPTVRNVFCQMTEADWAEARSEEPFSAFCIRTAIGCHFAWVHFLSRSSPEACFWNENIAFRTTLSGKSLFSNRELPICVGCWRCCPTVRNVFCQMTEADWAEARSEEPFSTHYTHCKIDGAANVFSTSGIYKNDFNCSCQCFTCISYCEFALQTKTHTHTPKQKLRKYHPAYGYVFFTRSPFTLVECHDEINGRLCTCRHQLAFADCRLQNLSMAVCN